MPVLRSSKLKDIVGDRGQRSIWKVVAFGAQSTSGRGVCRAPLTGFDPQWRRPLVRVQWPVVLSRIELDCNMLHCRRPSARPMRSFPPLMERQSQSSLVFKGLC